MAKRIKLTAEEFAEKQGRRLKAALHDIEKGIDRVTESPTEKAAKKQEKMLNNITQAIREGKWANGLRRVSLEDWKKAIKEKGVGRIAAGVDASRDKVRNFAEQLIAYQNSQLEQLEKMPDMTLQDSVARATFWITQMSKFRKK